jgi:hypothetical protein
MVRLSTDVGRYVEETCMVRVVMDPPLKGRACGLPLAVSSLPLGLLLPP